MGKPRGGSGSGYGGPGGGSGGPGADETGYQREFKEFYPKIRPTN